MLPVLLLLGCHCAAPPAAPAAPPPPSREAPPAGTLADLFGLNEAVLVPKRIAHLVSPEERDDLLSAQLEWVEFLGIRQVRVHSATWPFLSAHGTATAWDGDLAAADALLATLAARGIEPLVMVGPWPGNRPGAVTDTCLPADEEVWSAWVRATVERYDGDGVDDAPGIGAGVRAWEVDNEPDLHHHAPPKGSKGPASGSFCPPEDFARLVTLTAAAIRAADPQATVLPGGLLNPLGDLGAAYGEQLWTAPGFADSASGLNVHGYPRRSPGEVWRGVDRVLPHAAGRPVWVTETSTRSRGRGATERTQAADLAATWLEAARRGVERVYWHSLAEKPTVLERRPAAMTEGRHLLTGTPDDVEERWGMRRFARLHPKLAGWVLRDLQRRYGHVARRDVSSVEVEGALGVRLAGEVVVYSLEPVERAGTATLAAVAPGACLLLPAETAGHRVRGEPTWTPAEVRSRDGRLEVDLTQGPVRLTGGGC